MAYKLIDGSDSSQSSVPWVNEYLSEGGQVGDVTEIVSFSFSEDKVFIVGEKFKACIWKNQKTYKHLLEACLHYSQSQELTPSFALLAQKNGKAQIAVDSEILQTRIIRDNGKVFTVKKIGKGSEDSTDAPNSNPFLLLAPPTTVSKQRKGSA